MMRLLSLLCVLSWLVACDPVRGATIQVTPRALRQTDSATVAAAFAVAERVAKARDLKPTWGGDRWIRCFGEHSLFLCWRVHEGEAQFDIREAGLRLSGNAEGLREALLMELRARFGATQVRECNRRGCMVLARTDSAQRRAPPPEAY